MSVLRGSELTTPRACPSVRRAFGLTREMDCYVFVSPNAAAFTTDHTGDNLPDNLGPWQYVRKVGDGELRRLEANIVIRGLRSDGLAMINQKVQRRLPGTAR
jgi:hypothetical protein